MHVFFFETEDLDKPFRKVYIHKIMQQIFLLCRSLKMAKGKPKSPMGLLPIGMSSDFMHFVS